jgi:hypothetical protein
MVWRNYCKASKDLAALLHRGSSDCRFLPALVEIPANDDVVCGRGGSPAAAKVDVPFGRDEQIGDGKELLGLIVRVHEPPKLAPVAVVSTPKL